MLSNIDSASDGKESLYHDSWRGAEWDETRSHVDFEDFDEPIDDSKKWWWVVCFFFDFEDNDFGDLEDD